MQRYINACRQVACATESCTVAPSIGVSSERNFLHVTLLTPRILRLLLVVWKICMYWVKCFQEVCFHISIYECHGISLKLRDLLKPHDTKLQR
jgi:hypothetical protein